MVQLEPVTVQQDLREPVDSSARVKSPGLTYFPEWDGTIPENATYLFYGMGQNI